MNRRFVGRSKPSSFFPAPAGWKAIYFDPETVGTPVEEVVVGFGFILTTTETIFSPEEEVLARDEARLDGATLEALSDGSGWVVRQQREAMTAMVRSDMFEADLVPADQRPFFVGLADPNQPTIDWLSPCAEAYNIWLEDQEKERPQPGEPLYQRELYFKFRLVNLIGNSATPPEVLAAARTILNHISREKS